MMPQETPAQGRYDGVLCALLVVAAILAVNPFLEMGVIDDFSYVQTAYVFARTGHFVYNGWATAMLGWQIPYGALFVKLFGYHVWPLHLSTIVSAALTVPLLHAVMRRSGLGRANAVFATLLTCLSPIYLPVACSFMTDVGGLLTLTMCWYALLRALSAKTDRAVWLWLVAACAASVVGGTARQIVWVGALTMMPAAAWLLRRRKAVEPLAIVLWFLSLAGVLLSLHWFKVQPLSVPEPFIQGKINLKQLRQLANTELAGYLALVMLSLPVLVACIPGRSQWKARGLAKVAGATAAVTFLCYLITYHLTEHGWMPWTGDVVETLGIADVSHGFLLGTEPMMFSHAARVVGSFVIVGVCIAAIGGLWSSHRNRQDESGSDSTDWHTQQILLGGLLTGYLGLLLPRATWFEILDRYLLPLIPVVAVVVLRLCQQRIRARVPAAAWAALALWTLFGITGTHDWLQTRRARMDAVSRLGQAGIPPEHINAGFELNQETQLHLAGTMIDPRVTYPPTMHLVTKPDMPADLPFVCHGIYSFNTPTVRPEFFLAHQVVPCLEPSRFGAVHYRTWQPPYNRAIQILQRAK